MKPLTVEFSTNTGHLPERCLSEAALVFPDDAGPLTVVSGLGGA